VPVGVQGFAVKNNRLHVSDSIPTEEKLKARWHVAKAQEHVSRGNAPAQGNVGWFP